MSPMHTLQQWYEAAKHVYIYKHIPCIHIAMHVGVLALRSG